MVQREQTPGEFDLISRLERVFEQFSGSSGMTCSLGIGDDAAVLDVPKDQQMVVTMDTLVSGVHFPVNTPADAIGHKALAVNLSDLAAMGARPAWIFLSLTLPEADVRWLDEFTRGMATLAGQAGVSLAGGDMTQGPLSISITALGLVPIGKALTRNGAMPGDRVVVSGKPGSAARALRNMLDKTVPSDQDLAALNYPTPRVELGLALRGEASACIDVSDGLLADLGHVLSRSGVGACIDIRRLPDGGGPCLQDALSGGDDYELCFTLPPDSDLDLDAVARTCDVPLSLIGRVTSEVGIEISPEVETGQVEREGGYRHFSAGNVTETFHEPG